MGLVFGKLIGEIEDVNVWILGVTGGFFLYIALTNKVSKLLLTQRNVLYKLTVIFVSTRGQLILLACYLLRKQLVSNGKRTSGNILMFRAQTFCLIFSANHNYPINANDLCQCRYNLVPRLSGNEVGVGNAHNKKASTFRAQALR